MQLQIQNIKWLRRSWMEMMISMDYKVLVNIFVPETEQVFEMYIPINKTVSQVLILAIKLINNIVI